jgi:hypothetical protein
MVTEATDLAPEVSLPIALARFRHGVRAGGYRYRDLDAAFLKWLVEDRAKLAALSASEVRPDWTPPPDLQAWGLAVRPDVDLDVFTLKFVAACRAEGRRLVDIDAAWCRWLLGERNAGDEGGRARSRKGGADPDERFAAWGRAAARAQAEHPGAAP